MRDRGVWYAAAMVPAPDPRTLWRIYNQGMALVGQFAERGETLLALDAALSLTGEPHLELNYAVVSGGDDAAERLRDFVARDCFIRCEDDGFGWHALDAKTNGEPPTADCLAEDRVIWNTKHGNGLRVGASMETQRFENIAFRRIDVLEHANAAIRSDHSDWALCKNIRFEHFTDESSARTVEIVIAKTRYSNDTGYRDERGRYEGLHFSHLTSPGGEIILRGFDANHRIDQVTFENCVIGGRPVASRADLVTNEFVTNVSFTAATPATATP